MGLKTLLEPESRSRVVRHQNSLRKKRVLMCLMASVQNYNNMYLKRERLCENERWDYMVHEVFDHLGTSVGSLLRLFSFVIWKVPKRSVPFSGMGPL